MTIARFLVGVVGVVGVACGVAGIQACGSSEDGVPTPVDASAEASTDAGPADAGAQDAPDTAAPTCTTGLSGTSTNGVTCGTTECAQGEVCCLDDPLRCTSPAACPNLRLGWPCDVSKHCSAGKVCCFDVPLLDLDECPGTSLSTTSLCEDDDGRCRALACQTDADCASGNCYAVRVNAGPGDATRTIGVCR